MRSETLLLKKDKNCEQKDPNSTQNNRSVRAPGKMSSFSQDTTESTLERPNRGG